MIELALQHRLVAVDHLPRSGGTALNDINHRFAVQSGLLREQHRFGQALHQSRDADLVNHLGQLARTHVTHPARNLGEGSHYRLGPIIVVLRAAAHDDQLAILRARLSAADRRVDPGDALLGRRRRQFACHLGGYGRVIDEQRPFRHAREGPVVAQADTAQIVVIADAGHHDVATRRSGTRGFG